jgi:hypothetical protein
MSIEIRRAEREDLPSVLGLIQELEALQRSWFEPRILQMTAVASELLDHPGEGKPRNSGESRLSPP